MMFVMLGAWLFISSLTATRNQSVFLTLSAISFGAAGACKATYFLYAAAFFACWFLYSVTTTGQIKYLVTRSISFVLPVAFFVAILLAYNYLRFGSLFDFGRKYSILAQAGLYEYCCIKGHYFRLDHAIYNLYNYFFTLPSIHHGTRFTTLSFGGVHDIAIGDVVMGRQDLVSLPLMMPVLLAVLLTPMLLRSADRSRRFTLITASCIVSSVITFAALTFYHWAAARFLYEFTPLLFVIVYCGLVRLWETVRQNDGHRRLTVVGLALVFCANTMKGLIAAVIAFMYPR